MRTIHYVLGSATVLGGMVLGSMCLAAADAGSGNGAGGGAAGGTSGTGGAAGAANNMASPSADTGIGGTSPAIGGLGNGNGPGTAAGNSGTGINGTSPTIGGTGTGNGPGTAGGPGRAGIINPLGPANSGAANPDTTYPAGTSPLGSGPGGSNPLGTTQSATQGDIRPNTANPDAGTNLNNSNGNMATSSSTPSRTGNPNNQNRADMNQNGTGQAGSQDWRQVYHDNHWWYYTPSNNWLYYSNGRWNAYRGPGYRAVPMSGTASGNSYNGQYGVGYRGDTSIDTGATGQDLVPSSSTYRQSTPYSNSGGANLSQPTAQSSQRVAARPTVPTDAEIRTFDEQYFNAPALPNNPVTPMPGPGAVNRRFQPNPTFPARVQTGTGTETGPATMPQDRTRTTTGPGTGVDVTGIPPSSQ
jgi:hypothetical protein